MAEKETTACKAAKTAVTAAEGILATAVAAAAVTAAALPPLVADETAAGIAAGAELGLNPAADAWLAAATAALAVATTANANADAAVVVATAGVGAAKTAETAACS